MFESYEKKNFRILELYSLINKFTNYFDIYVRLILIQNRTNYIMIRKFIPQNIGYSIDSFEK